MIDADFDLCDNLVDPDVVPPLRCPLPSTYSGSMVSSRAGDNMKLFQNFLVRSFMLCINCASNIGKGQVHTCKNICSLCR